MSWRQSLRLFSFATLVLALTLPSVTVAAQGVKALAVTASDSDPRQYRALVFDNGFEALLIQEPGAQTHWVMTVAAGVNQDPATLPDLHRLAAMAKLAAVGADWRLRSEDRYSLFRADDLGELTRAAALLSATNIEQSLIARTQQQLADLQRTGHQVSDDERRIDVLRTLVASGHPLAQRTGQSASLVQLPLLEPELAQFWQRYYRPDNARLVVRSQESLDELQRRVSDAFVGLAPGPALERAPVAEMFADDTLPLQVDIRVQSGPQLGLYFPMSNPEALYRQKPLAVVTELLTDRGPGSLLSLLRSLGWAHTIQAGRVLSSDSDSLFALEIELTELGVAAREQVVALVFYVIEQIPYKGLKPWRFDELSRLAELDFLYNDARSARDLPELARRLHRVAISDILSAPYRFTAFDEKLVRRYLEFLRSDNVIIALSDSQVSSDTFTGYTRTAYRTQSAASKHPDIKLAVRRKLAFAEPNNFVPKRLVVKEAQLLPGPGGAADGALKVVDKPGLEAWFHSGQNLSMPTASVYLRLQLNTVESSADAAARHLLWAQVYRQQLDEILYNAEQAGAEYRLWAHPLGLDIEVAGFNSQLGLMLSRIGQAFSTPGVAPSGVKRARELLIEQLGRPTSEFLSRAYTDPLLQWHYRPSWSNVELIDALGRIQDEELRRAPPVGQLLMLCAGNLYRQEAQRLVALSEHYFLAEARPTGEQAQLVTAGRAPLAVAYRDGELSVYFQAAGSDARESVFTRALAGLLNGELLTVPAGEGETAPPPLAVRAEPFPVAGRPGLLLQSSQNASPDELLAAVLERLAEPDTGQRLDELKAVWRRQPREPELPPWQGRELWRELPREQTGDYRTALAALNSASIERYARSLFQAVPYPLVAPEDSQQRSAYQKARTLESLGPVVP